ncbi:hypothetical protein H0H81_004118 [Sphagnurus paluster]|uniref:Uncharacterized protein n=1 Tax=Sphagnurus paluster TaxID=117069 RepID=A0A9P7KMK2_9AGAR|nr:hypothetical protein H0H81_004118 [Sphagnurus paluster]
MANLLNTFIYFLAPLDAKAIGASFAQLITATMVSRLVLNLRSTTTFSSEDDPTPTFSMRFRVNTVGNLGGELETIVDVEEDTYDSIPMRIARGTLQK